MRELGEDIESYTTMIVCSSSCCCFVALLKAFTFQRSKSPFFGRSFEVQQPLSSSLSQWHQTSSGVCHGYTTTRWQEGEEVEAWPQIGLTPSYSLFPNRGLSQYTNSCCSGKKACPKGGIGRGTLEGVYPFNKRHGMGYIVKWKKIYLVRVLHFWSDYSWNTLF